MRNRAPGVDGTISADLIHQLTDLAVDQLDQLSGGELTRRTERADEPVFSTTDVVRALLKTPKPPPRAVASADEGLTS